MTEEKAIWDNLSGSIDFTIPIDIDIINELMPKDSYFLDFGCGYGRNSRLLFENGFRRIKGYDISDGMIARAKEECKEINFMVLGTQDIPEEDCTFDGILCSALFTCIPDGALRQSLIQELERILKIGGKIFISEFTVDEETVPEEFLSGLNIPMKYLRTQDLDLLMANFDKISSRILSTKTISGKASACIQYVARK